VISVIDDARLDPEAVGEHIDWRAATEAELRVVSIEPYDGNPAHSRESQVRGILPT
jgi:hypothetical protein